MRLLLITLILTACSDGTQTTTIAHIDPDHTVRLRLQDAELDAGVLDLSIRIWDARPVEPDQGIVDAYAPECTFGARRDCEVSPDLLGECNLGFQICNSDSWSQCSPYTSSRREVCDGLDNDCDGTVDESVDDSLDELLSIACYTGPNATVKFGVCRMGVRACQPLDDGSYGYGECSDQVLPSEEVCNSLDDDCNGHIDDLPDIGSECFTVNPPNIIGECSPGSLQCVEGDPEPQCVGETLPDIELCDELDNDCDGRTDELLGTCDCDNPFYVPRPEICNGIDDDCDGLVDNEAGLNVRLSSLCFTDENNQVVPISLPEDFPLLRPPCVGGRAICAEGEEGEYGYFDCQGEVRPGRELCDGLDNDCDGNADEGFHRGTAIVTFGIDISGSMERDEIQTAVNVANQALQRLAAEVNICYIISIIGRSNEPILVRPAFGCVPAAGNGGVNAQEALIEVFEGNHPNRGRREGSLDLIYDVSTDDRDVDGDGIPENATWYTNPNDLAAGHIDIDFSNVDHRIVVIISDEPAQSNRLLNSAIVAEQVHASGTIVYVVSPLNNLRGAIPAILNSYRSLLPQVGGDCAQSPNRNGCAHFYPIDRAQPRQEQERALADAISEVMSDLDCFVGD